MVVVVVAVVLMVAAKVPKSGFLHHNSGLCAQEEFPVRLAMTLQFIIHRIIFLESGGRVGDSVRRTRLGRMTRGLW